MSRRRTFGEPKFNGDTDSVTSNEHGEIKEQRQDEIPMNNPDFWKNKYQDEYQTDDSYWIPFEYYVSWDILQPHLLSYISKAQKVLHVGCGTSTLGIDMSTAGALEVVNIDISESVIDEMKAKEKMIRKKGNPIKWRVRDILQISEWGKSNEYDVIIDKGTIDTLACADLASRMIATAFTGISNSLQPNGYFIVISNGDEEIRGVFFDYPVYNWRCVEIVKIPKPLISDTYYYMYVYQKNEE